MIYIEMEGEMEKEEGEIGREGERERKRMIERKRGERE